MALDFWVWLLENKGIEKPKGGGLMIKDQYWREYQDYVNKNPAAQTVNPYQSVIDNYGSFQKFLADTYGYKWRDAVGDIWQNNLYGVVDYAKLSQNPVYQEWAGGGIPTTTKSNTSATGGGTGTQYPVTLNPVTQTGGGAGVRQSATNAREPAVSVTGTSNVIPDALKDLQGLKKYGNYWAYDDIVNGRLVRTLFDNNGEIFETQDLGAYQGQNNTDTTLDRDKFKWEQGQAAAQLAEQMNQRTREEQRLADQMKFDREQFEWQKLEAERNRAEQAAMDREKLLYSLSGPRSWIQYWQAKYGGLPATPQFVANYTGQQVGSQLAPTDVATPSGQWFNRAAPSVREGLLGFADFSASQNKSMTGEDLLNSMKNQLPTDSPYGNSRWLPMRK